MSTLPADLTSRQGFEALERSFGTGSSDAVLTVAVGDGAHRAGAELVRTIRRLPGFGRPSLQESDDGEAVLIAAPVAGDPDGEAATNAVRDLRASDAASPEAAEVLVTGETAEQADYSELIAFWLPIVIGFVLLCTLRPPDDRLPLARRRRSSRSPSTSSRSAPPSACSCSSSSTGVGAGLLGFSQVDAIEAWVPLFLFSVLFGLSMDYHVFIVSRIREATSRQGSTETAVAHGVASTARLITGAALIIIVVFVGFATGDLVMFQQMGFGVAVALADRRDARTHGPPAGRDDAARRAQLVAAVVAALAAGAAGRRAEGHTGRPRRGIRRELGLAGMREPDPVLAVSWNSAYW